MILAKLKEYADAQLHLPPEMYASVRVRWLVELTKTGRLEGFTALGNTDRGEITGELLTVPTLSRSFGIRPKLLVDNGEYVFGVPRDPSKSHRAGEAHISFAELIRACELATREPSVSAVRTFLEDWTPEAGDLPEDFDPALNLAFRVAGVMPADLESVREFWAQYTLGDEVQPVGSCLVTGRTGPVVRRLPVKVRGLPGGQRAGTSLVSANAPAFKHYGFKNALNSPISREAAEGFTKALSSLLNDPQHHVVVGPLVYVFWASGNVFDLRAHLEKPDSTTIRDLFEAPRKGSEPPKLTEGEVYVLALAANGGRAVVHGWLSSPIFEIQTNLRRWFEAQRISDPYGRATSPLGVYALAAAAYRDAAREMEPALPASLLRAALHGGQLTANVLPKALARIRAESDVTRARAALVKLALTAQGVPMDAMESLNTRPDLDGQDKEAYLCGRLLAALEAAQRSALGNVSTSLSDRYYRGACATPATVFPLLLKLSRAHVGKLQRARPWAARAVERRLEEIVGELPRFPVALTLEQQGLFSLGFYHQRAAMRAALRERRENEEPKEGGGDA